MDNDINNLGTFLPEASSSHILAMESFFELLEKYNSKMNLVSKASLPRAGAKHFADSYLGMSFIVPEILPNKPVFDFGSGNGFPGFICALMLPQVPVVMVEKDQRKAEFLKIGANHLELENVEIYAGSVADLADSSCFQIISRAMAPLPKFLLETRKVTASGGKAFLFKGDHWSTEFGAIPAQIFEYWDVEMMSHYELPQDEGSRYIIACQRN